MKYLDPREQPNRWLEAMLIRLLDNVVTKNDKESLELIQYAHKQLSMWIEPGVLQSAFSHWVDEYSDSIEQYQNFQSTQSLLGSLVVDSELQQK
jgi:hypothetical protein